MAKASGKYQDGSVRITDWRRILPLERIPSMAVALKPEKISVAELEERMRHLPDSGYTKNSQ